jgi:hypothetical protein
VTFKKPDDDRSTYDFSVSAIRYPLGIGWSWLGLEVEFNVAANSIRDRAAQPRMGPCTPNHVGSND